MGYRRAVWGTTQIKDHCTYYEKNHEGGHLDEVYGKRKEDLVSHRWTWNPAMSDFPNKENMPDVFPGEMLQ